MVDDTRLLIPGWAGVLTLEEAAYIGEHLAQDAKLRRLWHIRRRKRYPLQLIAEKALPQDPAEGRRLMENLLAVQSAARSRVRIGNLGENLDFPIAAAETRPVQLTLGTPPAPQRRDSQQ